MLNLLWAIAHPVFALKQSYNSKNWGMLVALCVLYVALSAAAILLLIYFFAFLSGVIISAYDTHKEKIDAGLFLLLCIVSLVWFLRQRKKPKEQPTPQPDVNAEQKAAERTYVNIGNVILPVFQKLANVFPLVSPISASDIYSPARARKEDEIWYYRYVAVKSGKPDIETVKRFLNDELERFLRNHEAHGLARNTVFIDGVEYPSLRVTEVKDTGTYLEISVVVMSEKVNRHLNFKRNSTLDAQGKKANSDDDQFIK